MKARASQLVAGVAMQIAPPPRGWQDRIPCMTLPPARYPALSRVQQAGVTHDPVRLFELALNGLILALQVHHPEDMEG